MTTRALHIAERLSLPLDTVTDTIGILAVKGAGKTFTFLVLVEQMIRAGLPVVVLDPVGVCWGLRSSADGKGEGLPVVILGGAHADAPLEPGAGRVIADFVVESRSPVVLDFSAFDTKVEQLRFANDFLTRLYKANREPLHVVIDEADELAPQKPFGEEARVLRAVEVLVRRGRARGLGCTLVTQRAAVINKNVLTQIATLFLGRTIAPQDRKAVEAWIDVHGTEEQKAELMESLAHLPTREKWIWSPNRDVFARVVVHARETFDSSATPKVGAARVEPKAFAPVDLEALRARIASTIERAKTDDPKALRARIAELERQLGKVGTAAPDEPSLDAARRQGLDEGAALGARAVAERALAHGARVDEAFRAFETMLADLRTAAAVPVPVRSVRPALSRAAAPARAVPPASARVDAPHPDGRPLAGGERKILTVLAQYPEGRSKTQVAILTGYASNGGGFGNYVSALRSRGLLEGGSERLRITDAGVAALGPFEPLPTGRALQEYWLAQLTKAERAILSTLADAYPHAMTKEAIAGATGYEARGGGFGNAISRLRTLELISGRAELRASDALFEGGSP